MAAMNKSLKEIPLELPPGFVQAVQNKRVVLFLGAGASMEARGPSNTRPPSGAALRESLARTFFGDPMPDYDLMSVADMAIARVYATYDGFTETPNSYAYFTETADDGTAKIRLTQPGLWMVRVEQRMEEKAADHDVYMARAVVVFPVKE